MKFLIIMIALISTLMSSELNWSDDYDKALKIAKKEKKHIYVFVSSSTCKWRRKFENTTLADTEILKMLNKKYVLVHIDKDIDDFPSWFEVSRVPKHYFVTSKGEEIFSFLGYWDNVDFRSFLQDVDIEYKKKIKNKKLKK